MAPPSANGPKRDINSTWEHDLFEEHEAEAEEQSRMRMSENSGPALIVVSNLHCNVSEEDLYDLFSIVGNLKGVCVNCDEYGRSLGTAKIFFQRKVDATEAVHRYHGRCLDDRPLKMEIETTMPIHHKNNISQTIQKNEVAEQPMDVAKVVDCFKFSKLK